MRKMREGKEMLNFTIGPVQSSQAVLDIGAEQTPYFRTAEFSKTMLENEALMKKFVNAEEDARTVFITGSGSAAMEAVVMNVFNENDKILVVNGGSFGSRFAKLCRIYGYEHTEIILESGKTLTREELYKYDGQGYTGFLVNIHETSTGVYYDLDMISEFCQKNKMFLAVDAISSFLADPFDMKKSKVDVMITGSQKALACPPGISIIVLSKAALDRVENNGSKCLYLDLKDALKNGERGQTPFTPAVSVLRQINCRLKEIDAAGGAAYENDRIKGLAEDFRNKIKDLPFEIASESLSNAVTPLRPTTCSAHEIFLKLKDEYGIWICPNGGELEHTLFRVGHIGELSNSDNDELIAAMRDLKERGII